jgi:hypothetical protein
MLALVTPAEDLVAVGLHPEIERAADALLKRFDLGLGELSDGAAAEADKVVVVLTPVEILVKGPVPSQLHLVYEP